LEDDWVPEGGLAAWMPPLPPLVSQGPEGGWEEWGEGEGLPAFFEMASAQTS
jgi:hypothetical protein